MSKVANAAAKNVTQHPKKSPELRQLYKDITELNDLYWGFQAGAQALTTQRPSTAEKVGDFLNPDIAKHFNVELGHFDDRIKRQSVRVRRLCLVDAIAYYEGYLYNILVFYFKTRTRATTDPEAAAKLIVDERYGRRPNAVAKALGVSLTSENSVFGLEIEFVIIACILRNSITHARSILTEDDVKFIKSCLSSISKRNMQRLAKLKKLQKELEKRALADEAEQLLDTKRSVLREERSKIVIDKLGSLSPDMEIQLGENELLALTNHLLHHAREIDLVVRGAPVVRVQPTRMSKIHSSLGRLWRSITG